MILNSAVLLFELAGHRPILIGVASAGHLSVPLILVRIVVHNKWLPLARAGVTFWLCDSLATGPWNFMWGRWSLLTLATAIWSIKNNLMSVVTVVALRQDLLLGLDLLIVGQLRRVIHVNLSALIKVHISWGVEHRLSTLSDVVVALHKIRVKIGLL